jgi:amino acid adenylation domain-containing protein
MDGWSLAAMLTELFQEYSLLLEDKKTEGAATDHLISAPLLSYRDFIALELQAGRAAQTRTFWEALLEQPNVQNLPRWPAEMRHGGTEQRRGPEIIVEAEVLAGLKRLAQAEGVPLRTVLLTAHCRVMAVVTGQTDIMTGLVSNGRPQASGGERLIGLFLNTVPLRLSIGGGTWHELVRETFKQERALLPHRRCPLPVIQQLAGGQGLFETVFDFVQFHVYRDLPGYRERSFLEDHYFEANNFAFYMTCMLDASGSELQMHCDYDPNELCEPQIQLLSQYYHQTLRAMAHSPDARYETHSPLPQPERERLLTEWNGTARDLPAATTVYQRIAAQALQTPDAVAAISGAEVLTYGALEQRAAALAKQLRALGLGPGGLVGIHQGRSLDMLVSLLAVLKAGAAYVPLDPAYPPTRLEFMMEDAGLEWVLTSQAVTALPHAAGRRLLPIEKLLPSALPEVSASNELDDRGGPDDRAYVIYTSGSTGQPKGVQVSHRALFNLLLSMQRVPGFTAADTLLAVTTLSFDIAGLELFLPLISGGKVVIAGAETALDPQLLAASLEEHQASVLQATPTTWRLLVQSGWAGNRKLKALCGGEPMPRDLADALLPRCGELWNMYGPTETCIWSAVEKVGQGAGPVPIGRPIDNTEFYILDSHRNPAPTGTVGEIYIGGLGLAQGYLGRPELTTERFVPHPFASSSQARLYRTGDLGRYLPDGKLICLGRTDQQVKVRGFRIELGEVETTLASHPAVAAAVVWTKEEQTGGSRLVAYYLRRRGAATDARDLRQFLEGRLPNHMVPSAFIPLTQFPLTPNGKVDRLRLPEPMGAQQTEVRAFVAPRTPLEQRLASLWSEILKVERIGIGDNFFELGGHSLLAIQLVGRLRAVLGVSLNVAVLFANPTLESFALQVLQRLLEAERNEANPGGGLEIKSSVGRSNESLSVS